MFQYAAGRRLSYKHNTVLKIDTTPFKRYKLQAYSLGAFITQSGKGINFSVLFRCPPSEVMQTTVPKN